MKRDPIRNGAVAGVVGATTMVLWFLAIDLARTEALTTPRFIASMLFGDSALASVPVWTVLHYLAFVVVGIAMAAVARRLHIAAPTLLGVALGFLLFDLVFYGSVASTGTNVVSELGWPWVLIGNVLAALALTHTLHRLGPDPRPSWIGRALRGPVAREGLIIGVIGGLTVAIWFLALDAIQGTLFLTPSALGGLVFAGETAPASVQAAWVVGYTIVHFVAFAAVGLVLAALADSSDHRPPLVIGVFLAFIAFEAFAMGMVAVLAELVPHAWWTFLGANLLAAAAMGALLFARHPVIGYGLTEDKVLAQAE